jgi:hypothetical protein
VLAEQVSLILKRMAKRWFKINTNKNGISRATAFKTA